MATQTSPSIPNRGRGRPDANAGSRREARLHERRAAVGARVHLARTARVEFGGIDAVSGDQRTRGQSGCSFRLCVAFVLRVRGRAPLGNPHESVAVGRDHRDRSRVRSAVSGRRREAGERSPRRPPVRRVRTSVCPPVDELVPTRTTMADQGRHPRGSTTLPSSVKSMLVVLPKIGSSNMPVGGETSRSSCRNPAMSPTPLSRDAPREGWRDRAPTVSSRPLSSNVQCVAPPLSAIATSSVDQRPCPVMKSACAESKGSSSTSPIQPIAGRPVPCQ